MQRRKSLSAAAVLLVMLGGCNKEASGQTIAVVNGEEVSQSELNDELALANLPQNADRQQVMPQLVQRVVDRKLMAQAAIEQGVDRSPEYISRSRRLNEELLVSMLGQRSAQTIKIPTQAEIDAFIKANPSMFEQRAILSLDQIQFAPPADNSVLGQLKDDHSLAEVAATLEGLGISFTRTSGKLDTATISPSMAAQIEKLPPGEPFVVPSPGRIAVSVVTAREPAGVSEEQNRSVAADALRRRRLGELLDRQLKEARSAAKIEYQPGFEPKAAPAGGSPAK